MTIKFLINWSYYPKY